MPSVPIIAVMGQSGSGKYEFIKTFVIRDWEVENVRQSGPMGIRLYPCESANLGKFYLLDTPMITQRMDYPGYIGMTEARILNDVQNWMFQMFSISDRLDGIVYLHSIDERNMTGPLEENLAAFQRLCKKGLWLPIVCATVNWDRYGDRIGKQIENEARLLDFWGHLQRHGTRTCHLVIGNKQSSEEVLRYFRDDDKPMSNKDHDRAFEKEGQENNVPLSSSSDRPYPSSSLPASRAGAMDFLHSTDTQVEEEEPPPAYETVITTDSTRFAPAR